MQGDHGRIIDGTRRVRPAAVAGTFYPGSAQELEQTISDFLGEVQPTKCTRAPKGIVVPHAGYVYSGSIAASAYAHVVPFASRIDRVVLVGPAHRVPLRGIALPDVDCFETPLGRVEMDEEGLAAIEKFPQVKRSFEAHAEEHSLEVQLPFLQKIILNFKLIPLVVGKAEPEEIAEVLHAVWGGEETLFVISTDLSHGLSYDVAQRMDEETAKEIVTFEVPIGSDQACGAGPINGFLLSAKEHSLQPELLDLRNSGDTAGDRGRVVGYTSFAFCEASDG